MSTARRSIRLRVTGVATFGMAAVLLTMSALLVWWQHRLASDALDEDLQRRADALSVLPSESRGAVPVPDDDLVVQIIDGGEVVGASDGLDDVGPLLAAPAEGGDVVATRNLPIDEGAFRLLARPTGPDSTIIVGESTDDLGDATLDLLRTLAVLVPGAVMAMGALVWWTVGRTLRPVERMRAEVASITLDRLDRRVDDPGGDDEIARLARTLNDMVDRLEEANLAQRRFLDDASHELRTPLTRLRAELELAIAAPGDATATCRTAHADVVAMSRLVDDLLFLAEGDQGREAPPARAVDLDTVVLDAVAVRRAAARVPIETRGVAPAAVTGDERRLSRLVGNLLDNAVDHAGSRVVVELAEHHGIVELGVSDDGPGIPGEDRARVFERFARLDDARSAAPGGTGLGLAIVADISRHHGGSVAVTDAPEGGARIVVTLPARPSD